MTTPKQTTLTFSTSLTLILLFSISLTFAQKADSKYNFPRSSKTNKIAWEGKGKVDSLSVEQMATKLISWTSANNYLFSIIYGNNDTKIIEIKGKFKYVKGTGRFTTKELNGTFKINVALEKGGYSFEINNVSMTRYQLDYIYETQPAKESLNLAYSNIDIEMNKIKNNLMTFYK